MNLRSDRQLEYAKLCAEFALVKFRQRYPRRMSTVDVMDALLTSYQRSISAAIGTTPGPTTPAPPRAVWTCPDELCGDLTIHHSDLPGYGCTVPGCLCLRTASELLAR